MPIKKNRSKENGFAAWKLIVFFLISFTLIAVWVAYQYFDAEEMAIRKYKHIYESGDIRALEAFATDNYYNDNRFQYRRNYFEKGTSVFVGLGAPQVEISRKWNKKGQFTLKNVPFVVANGERKITVSRDITFVKKGLFKYRLGREEFSLPDDNLNGKTNDDTMLDMEHSSEFSFKQTLRDQIKGKVSHDNFHAITRQVLATIYNWKVAWTSKNLDTYMSFYSEDASITRVTLNERGEEINTSFLNKNALRKRMKKLNDKYEDIVVEVFNPEVRVLSRAEGTPVWEVRVSAKFEQLFSGGAGDYRYTDFGNKEMLFRRQEGQWKIVAESWKPRKVRMAQFREIFPELFQN